MLHGWLALHRSMTAWRIHRFYAETCRDLRPRGPKSVWSYHQEKNQDTTGRYVFAWRSDMKCRSLLSAHMIHELFTGSRLQLACCTTLFVFFNRHWTVVRNQAKPKQIHGIPMLTPRLEIRKDFLKFFFGSVCHDRLLVTFPTRLMGSGASHEIWSFPYEIWSFPYIYLMT